MYLPLHCQFTVKVNSKVAKEITRTVYG